MTLFDNIEKYLNVISREKVCWWILILAILLQLSEVKVYSLKPIEAFGLFMLLYNALRLSRMEWAFIGYFSFFLILTLWRNNIMPFPEQDYDHPLKQPYLISFARYFEYVSCIGVLAFVRQQILTQIHFSSFIRRFILFSAIFNILILVLYSLEYFDIALFDVAYYSSGLLRLKGFYYEGGPYGLYNAFLLILSLVFFKSSRRAMLAIYFFVFIILCLSKAGGVAIGIFFVYITAKWVYGVKRPIFEKGILFLVIAVPILYVCFRFINIYADSIFRYDELIKLAESEPDHSWISGGRVPGIFILKEMFLKHPIWGIGMGNYQLLRNALIFRLDFPVTNLWDYHGFGGVAGIINQFGIVGFVIFLWILFKFSIYNKILLRALFILLFCLGLQLHFHYPWMLLAGISFGTNINKYNLI